MSTADTTTYYDYDDFAIGKYRVGGVGAMYRRRIEKSGKHKTKGNTGVVYSSKHIRSKDSLRAKRKGAKRSARPKL